MIQSDQTIIEARMMGARQCRRGHWTLIPHFCLYCIDENREEETSEEEQKENAYADAEALTIDSLS